VTTTSIAGPDETCVICGAPSSDVECDDCFDREDIAAVRRADR
jgi:hypothetical protein